MAFKNQVALVTGAASGIGYAYTKHLLQNGVKVALCDIDFERCQSVANEFAEEFGVESTLALHCDVTDQEIFENAFNLCIDYFKRLDIVVNNAGVFNESMENWHSTLNINYGGVVRGTMLAIKYLGAPNGGKGGTVIQTASIAAFGDVFKVVPVYKSTKRAVVEYTRAIGDEKHFKHLNLRIMALCPGFASTQLVKDVKRHQYLDRYSKELSEIMQELPVQEPDNVGKALICILEHGKGGDCWVVEDGKSPRLAVIPNDDAY